MLLRSKIPKSILYLSQNCGFLHRVIKFLLLLQDCVYSKNSLLKVFRENITIAVLETCISTRFKTVVTLIFQNIIKLVSASSMFRPVGLLKTSLISISFSRVIYRRMVVIFIKKFVYEVCQFTTISKNSISFDLFFFFTYCKKIICKKPFFILSISSMRVFTSARLYIIVFSSAN